MRWTLALALSLAACTASSPDSLSGGWRQAGSSGGSGGGATDDGGAGGVAGSSSGGGGSSSSGGGASGAGLPCDVNAVLAANCQQCHGTTPSYGATMSLMTWSDLQAPAPSGGGPVYQAVETRIHDTSTPMPPTPYPLLSSSDMSTLDTWIAAGAPSSRDVCAPPADAGTPVVEPLPCTPDTLIRPASPYAMADSGEQYVCYGLDVTVTDKRQVIAMAPHLDNTAILHHLLLFQSSTAVSSTPTPCSGGGSTAWSLIGGWAPGGKDMILPPQAGFPESGTTHWVMQVHYYNAKGLQNQTDSSGFDLCTTDQLRPNDAAVMAPGSVNFSIPARSTLNLTCSYTFPTGNTPINVFTATPHMHLLGKSLSASVLPGGTGTPVSIVDQPNWDFQTQLGYPATNVVNAGDVIQTQCDWQNSTDQAVSFGEDTTDEMCFAFLAYYPAITTPLWSWVVPAALGSCTSQ
jgi:hypothetical protein